MASNTDSYRCFLLASDCHLQKPPESRVSRKHAQKQAGDDSVTKTPSPLRGSQQWLHDSHAYFQNRPTSRALLPGTPSLAAGCCLIFFLLVSTLPCFSLELILPSFLTRVASVLELGYFYGSPAEDRKPKTYTALAAQEAMDEHIHLLIPEFLPSFNHSSTCPISKY